MTLAAALDAVIAAEPKDAEAFAALNAAVTRAAWTPGLMMHQDVPFFDAVHAAGGAVILLRDTATPFGYTVAVPAGPDMSAFSATDTPVGLLFGTVVLEGYRGAGWQSQLIALRLSAFQAIGLPICQAIVAPANHQSLGNLLANGFEVVGAEDRRAGASRFVVERCPKHEATPAEIRETLSLPPYADLGQHKALLALGLRGVAVPGPEGLRIGYRPGLGCTA